LRLVGSPSNRNAIGAVVRIESAAGRQSQMVHSGSSYCSQSDLGLTFGLGQDAQATLEILWPSGARQRIPNVRAGQFLTIEEAKGITSGVARAAR
ncbi:MAG TPA: ASPIC/UnbV domain-containing protein, partial [Bryobacteraceae bacterium]|nr:ASPIC/UnbV domain-containing protein [Bryobacteraceae bacterium]